MDRGVEAGGESGMGRELAGGNACPTAAGKELAGGGGWVTAGCGE